MYRECLIERQRFKKIAREYGLINNATALINSHNRVLNNQTMYYNSSLVYFNHKTANSYFSTFNFLLNGSNGSGAVTHAVAGASLNGSLHLSNGTSNGNGLHHHDHENGTTNSNNTFNINSLLANGDLIDGKKKGKRSENDKEMM